jgi:hypothetical protein
MDTIYEMLGLFATFGVAVMALSIFIVHRVYAEIRRQRYVAAVYQEKLAAYRRTVEIAGGRA